jgi:hypothetical protein
MRKRGWPAPQTGVRHAQRASQLQAANHVMRHTSLQRINPSLKVDQKVQKRSQRRWVGDVAMDGRIVNDIHAKLMSGRTRRKLCSPWDYSGAVRSALLWARLQGVLVQLRFVSMCSGRAWGMQHGLAASHRSDPFATQRNNAC